MTKDVLRALTDARPAHLDPGAPTPGRTRTAELAHAMAAPRDAKSRSFRIAKPVWGAGLVGVAAVTALAVAVSGGMAPRAPGRSNAGGDQTVPMSASQILLAAADSSLRTPAGSGAYWYTSIEHGNYLPVGTKTHYLVKSIQHDWNWVARSPMATSWFTSQFMGTHPADEAAWRADGSPTHWRVSGALMKGQAAKGGPQVDLSTTGNPSSGNPINTGPLVFDLVGTNVSVRTVMDLPGDEAALRRRLLRGYAGHGTESNGPMGRDPWLFQVTINLLSAMPVSPATRAAAYKILAHLAGTRPLGQVKDALGRTGQGVAMADGPDGLERQIIVDTRTGLLLSDQEAVLRASASYPWAKPGTVVFYEAVQKAGWSDAQPIKPTHQSP
jgi:hypothetical protein